MYFYAVLVSSANFTVIIDPFVYNVNMYNVRLMYEVSTYTRLKEKVLYLYFVIKYLADLFRLCLRDYVKDKRMVILSLGNSPGNVNLVNINLNMDCANWLPAVTFCKKCRRHCFDLKL